MNALTNLKYIGRIMVKTNSKKVIQRMGSFLNPLYGMLLGAKAAAHSAMLHFKHFPHDRVLINLHFNKNGLTTDIIRRSCITLFNSCLMPMCIHPSHLNTSHQSSAFVLKPVNHYSHQPVHTVDTALEPKCPLTPPPLFLIYFQLDSANTAKRLLNHQPDYVLVIIETPNVETGHKKWICDLLSQP